MYYREDTIVIEDTEELQEIMYCECQNPFKRDKGYCPKCKKQWFYVVESFYEDN